MKRNALLPLILAGCLALSLCACKSSAAQETSQHPEEPSAVVSDTQETPQLMDDVTAAPEVESSIPQVGDLYLQIGETALTATLADNSSVDALRELLTGGPLTIAMSDYANFEKVGPIGQSLPTNNEQITTEPGDLILYQGSSFVIYYAPNSWNFTRLGKINDVTAEDLREILGPGDVTVTLSLDGPTQ